MKLIKEGIWNMEKDVDLIYSPDDHGYYFHNFATDKITKVYAHVYEATKAYSNKKLIWIGD